MRSYIRGRGMEVGALWKRFPVNRTAQVWYVDRFSVKDLRIHYPEIVGPLVSPDVVADANDLPVAPSSLDFIIVSHLLEHRSGQS